MARISLDSPQHYINRDTSWLAFNRRVLEEASDEGNPLLEQLKFLSISASNLDEFFEVRVAAMMQQIEDGYNEAGPDGLTLTAKRDILSKLTHEFVDDQYDCWNDRLRPALAENGIRVLGLNDLDAEALRFVDEYCERELDPLLTPVTVDPAHPFPRVINKALCVGFLGVSAFLIPKGTDLHTVVFVFLRSLDIHRVAFCKPLAMASALSCRNNAAT